MATMRGLHDQQLEIMGSEDYVAPEVLEKQASAVGLAVAHGWQVHEVIAFGCCEWI